MANPTISFRLNKYQIARGLDIILRSIPDYKPSSISNIVKICYLDYVAKMGKETSLTTSNKATEKIKALTTSTDPLNDILSELQTSSEKTESIGTENIGSKATSNDVKDFFDTLKKEKE